MNAVAVHMFMTFKAQLMVAVARRTLQSSEAFCTQEAESEDTALATEHADVYPRAAMTDWEPALQMAGLVDEFEAAFAQEWRGLLERHVANVDENFKGIFSSDGVAELLQEDEAR